ncbi:LOW QUALITY PROTEIN: Hypothetical protein PHPALM_36425 [Phytophthora palmivora]|uniref:Integrase zinc-binding domain-containing protein n=1 Tax=Phytophthora palmivora TaxID=4796 RepID=A0A2P4WZZ9_9STRA|nr:LOW QUALITY PROTEIN: Hypothetical protein PHPALM_36425 [Phytophthora palmivora]
MSKRPARIIVVAHCGSQGHRGQESMVLIAVFIVELNDKVAKFIHQCLLCKHFKGNQLTPRPYGHLKRLTGLQRSASKLKRNGIIYFTCLIAGGAGHRLQFHHANARKDQTGVKLPTPELPTPEL